MASEKLLDTLDDLDNEEFNKFKWFLQQADLLQHLPTIKKKLLEQKSTYDMVTLMQKTYGLSTAVEVTKTILAWIPRKDLLERLVGLEARVAPPTAHANVTTAGVTTSDIGKGPRMKKTQICLLKTNLQGESQVIQSPESSSDGNLQPEDQSHLDPQLRPLSLERNQQPFKIPVGLNCKTHNEPLELICVTDEKCICSLCYESDHKTHEVVSLVEESGVKKNRLSVKDIKGSMKMAKEDVAKAIAQLEKKIREIIAKHRAKAELNSLQQYAVAVTLDPDTAHPDLVLSDDGKQVFDSDKREKLPDDPGRFSKCPNVLGKQSFSSGSFYFEVKVKRKTDWDLGVAKESVNRKGNITLRPQDGFWCVVFRNGKDYKAGASPSVLLSLQSDPKIVGVFVDYEVGQVSFYDVGTAALIYSFTACSFEEKLYPYFSPGMNYHGKNSAPLTIRTVNAPRKNLLKNAPLPVVLKQTPTISEPL